MSAGTRTRSAKHAAYLRSKGWSVLVPVGPAQTHLRWLHHTHGMSAQAIAAQSTVSEATVSEIIAGRHYGEYGRRHPLMMIRRENAESLLAVRPVPPTGRKGARVNACGPTRRVQALAVLGFPVGWSAQQCGHHQSYFGLLVRGERQFVYASTAQRIRELYEKYELSSPQECGLSSRAIRIAQMHARQSGYAPPATWDWRTLDDPDGFPDWTGACGTEEGTELHLTEGILPVCDPCAALWHSR